MVWLSSRARRSASRSRTSACRSRAIGRSSGRGLAVARPASAAACSPRQQRLHARHPAAPADLGDHHRDERDHRRDRRRTGTTRTCACPRCAAGRSSCRARSSARPAIWSSAPSGFAETCSGPSGSFSTELRASRRSPAAQRTASGKAARRVGQLAGAVAEAEGVDALALHDALEVAQHALARAAAARASARPAAPARSAR